jgi:hypothetical protein
LHQRTNDSAERGRGLPMFGTGLLVLAALGLVVIGLYGVGSCLCPPL